MDRVSKLMVFLIVAVTLPALLVAAPPAKTQECIITGDIVSNGVVEGVVKIGISVPTWVLLDGQSDSPASLSLKGSLLQASDAGDPTDLLYADMIVDEEGMPKYESCTGSGPCDPANPESLDNLFEYYGHARVLKKDGRFDFEFGPSDGSSVCESVTYDDGLPPYAYPLCPYRLIIFDGIYDRTADVVTFDSNSRVALMDYSRLEDREYHVGDGPVSGEEPNSGITIEFLTDGDNVEIEPEKTSEQCTDEVDNDGDGLIDEKDPNCKKWFR